MNNKNFSNHLLNWLEYVMQIDCCLSTCFCLWKNLKKKSVYFSVMRWNIAIIYLFRLNKQNHPSSNTHRAQPQHSTNKYTIAMRITTNVAGMEKNLQFHYANSKVVNKTKNNGKIAQSTHKIHFFLNITELEIIGNFSIR